MQWCSQGIAEFGSRHTNLNNTIIIIDDNLIMLSLGCTNTLTTNHLVLQLYPHLKQFSHTNVHALAMPLIYVCKITAKEQANLACVATLYLQPKYQSSLRESYPNESVMIPIDHCYTN